MASDNVGSFLGTDVADLLQQPLSRVISEAAVETIRSRVDHLSRPGRDRAPVRCRAPGGQAALRSLDPLLRRLSGHRGRAQRQRARRQFRRARPPDAGAYPQDARHDRARPRGGAPAQGADRLRPRHGLSVSPGRIGRGDRGSRGSRASNGFSACTIRPRTSPGRPASSISATGCASSPISMRNQPRCFRRPRTMRGCSISR